MYEPTVLEYIRAAGQLDRAAFCGQFSSPVLVSCDGELGQAFQDTKTRLSNPRVGDNKRSTDPSIQGLAPVISVQSAPGRNPDLFTLGRSEENDLVLKHETVSSHHAVLARDDRGSLSLLKDLSSTNGTRVNGQPVAPGQPHPLADGDRVRVGDVRFLFYTPGGFYRVLQPKRTT